MCYDEVCFADVEDRHSICFDDYFAVELAGLADLRRDGLVRLDNGAIRVTAAGRLLMRNIAMQFDRHIKRDICAERYSKAI
jgi:oxygen-independent coproporphyrinogen-3 oxidase